MEKKTDKRIIVTYVGNKGIPSHSDQGLRCARTKSIVAIKFVLSTSLGRTFFSRRFILNESILL